MARAAEPMCCDSSGHGFFEASFWSTDFDDVEGDTGVDHVLFTLLAILPGPGEVKPVVELARLTGFTPHQVIDVLVEAWLDHAVEFDLLTDTFFINKQGNDLPTQLPQKEPHGTPL